MGADAFVPLVFFLFLGAIILVPIWLKEKTKQSAHALISQALEKGQTLDPAVLAQLSEGAKQTVAPDRPRRTLGSGVVLLALAGGFIAASFLGNGMDGMVGDGMVKAAAILGALGIAFILLAIVDYSSKNKG
jgi:hypothetical protein